MLTVDYLADHAVDIIFALILAVMMAPVYDLIKGLLSRLMRSSNEPPGLAEWLLAIFAKDDKWHASISDDLNEMFDRYVAAGLSLKRARRRFWIQALRSILPQLQCAVARWLIWLLRGCGFLALLSEAAKHLVLK